MKGGFSVALAGLAGAIITAVVSRVTEICPTLIPNIWPILTAGVLTGVALWMKSPAQDSPNDEPAELASDPKDTTKRAGP